MTEEPRLQWRCVESDGTPLTHNGKALWFDCTNPSRVIVRSEHVKGGAVEVRIKPDKGKPAYYRSKNTGIIYEVDQRPSMAWNDDFEPVHVEEWED